MDATTALGRTNEIMTGVISGLRPEHREQSTPCKEWTVHDVLDHVCQGGHHIAGGLQGQAPPEESPDYLAQGPAAGWSDTYATLQAAATPEILAATHQMPFGEVPGEAALSVIVADHLVHAWDVATATGQSIEIDAPLAQWALQTWQMVVPAEGRSGPNFADVVPVPDDAPTVDRLIAYTGRQP